MTVAALNHAIARLLNKRAKMHGNEQEQARINEKLSKLYDLKFIMQTQDK